MTASLAALLGALATLLISVFIRFDWTPKIKPTLGIEWVDRTQRRYVLRLELENTSNVPVIKKACRLQVLEHSKSKQPCMSEFVPFTEEFAKGRPEGEQPIVWKEPQEVFSSTLYLYPGEKITVERLGQIEDPDSYLHMALQFEGHLPVTTRIAFWIQKALRFAAKAPNERWTTTALVYPPMESGENTKI